MATPHLDTLARVLAAQNALRTGDIGSMQEEHLLAIVAAAPSSGDTSGDSAVGARRVANAQLALLSPDLGSLQEDALAAVGVASSVEDES